MITQEEENYVNKWFNENKKEKYDYTDETINNLINRELRVKKL